MGKRYWISRENFTPTGGTDVLTIVSPSTGRVSLLDITARGAGTTSAQQGLQIARSTGGSSTSTFITPAKADYSGQSTAGFLVNSTMLTQPTLNSGWLTVGFNALGGSFTKAFPSGMFEAMNRENISIFATTNPTWQAMSLSVLVEDK